MSVEVVERLLERYPSKEDLISVVLRDPETA
jgi:hypothetical protein